MASYTTGIDVLKDALVELEEAKKLLQYGINGNCNSRAIQKIEFVMMAIRAKIETQNKNY